MQKFIFLILLCLVSILSYPASIVSQTNLKVEQTFIAIPHIDAKISLSTLIKLKPKEYKHITGERLSLKEILALKLVQVKIKKGLRKGQPINLYLSKTEPRKKPKLWVALLIVLGITLLVFGIFITIGSLAF